MKLKQQLEKRRRARGNMRRKTHILLLNCKSILFRMYWLSPLSLIGVPFLIDWLGLEKTQTYLGAIGGIFAFMFFVQKQKIDESSYFQELFKNFNRRYDSLNNKLYELKNVQVLSNRNKLLLDDYFNLCAEEYLLFKQGYIPLNVWKSWVHGMNQYWSNESIRKYWQSEINGKSYYGFEPEKILTVVENENAEHIKVAA